MKRNFKLSGFIFFALVFLFPSNLKADLELPFENPEIAISMDFQDASLKDILKIFSVQSGLNFIASEGVQERKVTLYLDKVGVKEAMDKLFKANNLAYELDPDSNIFIVKDLGKPQVETITKVFYLKHATLSSSSIKEEMYYNNIARLTSSTTTGGGGTATSGKIEDVDKGRWATETDVGITKVIKKLLSEYGSAIEDFRTNSLIVTDIPSRMPTISSTIALLDIPAAQVMLEVEMLDVSKNTVDKMGIKYGQTPFTAVLTGTSAAFGFPFHSWGKLVTANRGSLAINSGTNTYTVTLDFLRTQTDTKFLARPRILTLNNETAEIKIATQESVGVKTTTEASTGTTQSEPERAETGVSLRVTPQINLESGEITMYIFPQVSEATAGNTLTSNNNSFRFRDPEVRSTKSIVRLKDGDTVVIGGLIRNEKTQTITKLPILGDLPLVGGLFRHKDKEKDKGRELLVFITPHIIKDTALKLAQTKLDKVPEREQNTLSVFNREAVIKASLNSLDKK